jgi:hypothetical protein
MSATADTEIEIDTVVRSLIDDGGTKRALGRKKHFDSDDLT